ncbi:inositol monophosphatase family protein [Polycladospora coralii]|uniref:inositol monophosphatase family protein n=1 Tax=Polycladospora coralii TaxID=2771432 RepID=UPI0020C0DD23|nr:inositol monophosphatase [Polycladospora coralii]
MTFNSILNRAKKTAIKATSEAGALILLHFERDKKIEQKGTDGDVVTEVDRMAERLIRKRIKSVFVDHQIRGEEFGQVDAQESEWIWLIDPLDGTNNYAIGLPVYAVCVTLMYRNEPVLGIIYEPHLHRMHVAQKDRGAQCNEQFFTMKKTGEAKPTLAWIQGHHVLRDPNAMRLRASML